MLVFWLGGGQCQPWGTPVPLGSAWINHPPPLEKSPPARVAQYQLSLSLLLLRTTTTPLAQNYFSLGKPPNRFKFTV